MRPFHFDKQKNNWIPFKAIFLHRDLKLFNFPGDFFLFNKGVRAVRIAPAISVGMPNMLSQAVVVFVSLIAELANHRLRVQVHVFHMV